MSQPTWDFGGQPQPNRGKRGSGESDWFPNGKSQDDGKDPPLSKRSIQTDTRVRERKERHHPVG